MWLVRGLIYPALPPASAKGQIHQKCQIDHIAFLSRVPVGNKNIQPAYLSWFSCIDSMTAWFSF